MKFTISFFLVLTAFINTFAQVSVVIEGTTTQVTDGSTITSNTDGETKHFIITNNHTKAVRSTLEVMNIVNTDGSEMGFCFGFHGQGNCYFFMTQGSIYDSNLNGGSNPEYLQPGESTTPTDIDFTHTDAENTTFTNYPKDYVLKLTFYDTNDTADTIDDTVLQTINFTYRYDPNAQAINTFNKNDIVISTAHRHVVIIDSKYSAQINLFNLTGKKVKETTLKPYQNHIYTGDLPEGIYILHVKSGHKELYKKLILH